jgi:hypothetical protein
VNKKRKRKIGKKFFVLSPICLFCLFSLSVFFFPEKMKTSPQVENVMVCFGLDVSVSFLVLYFLGNQMEGHVLII